MHSFGTIFLFHSHTKKHKFTRRSQPMFRYLWHMLSAFKYKSWTEPWTQAMTWIQASPKDCRYMIWTNLFNCWYVIPEAAVKTLLTCPDSPAWKVGWRMSHLYWDSVLSGIFHISFSLRCSKFGALYKNFWTDRSHLGLQLLEPWSFTIYWHVKMHFLNWCFSLKHCLYLLLTCPFSLLFLQSPGDKQVQPHHCYLLLAGWTDPV